MRQTLSDDRPKSRASGDQPVSVRTKLAALWASVMFLYVYVDIFSLYAPGTIDEILVGRVWEFDISPSWALGALALMTIPSLMVALSVTLPSRVARWSNLVAGTLLVPVSIGNALGETWSFYWVGAAIETALLVMIIRYAVSWRPYAG